MKQSVWMWPTSISTLVKAYAPYREGYKHHVGRGISTWMWPTSISTLVKAHGWLEPMLHGCPCGPGTGATIASLACV